MKKFVAILSITLLLTVPTSTIFATGSTQKEATNEAEMNTIEKIKEMVADKVSKLNIIEKRGFIGTVQDTSNTQITVLDLHGKKRFIDIDELTKFQESIGSSKTFGISDIEKGERLAFVGQYNTETERLLARFVTTTGSIPQYIHGEVTAIDNKAFTFTVTTEDGKKNIIDIERSTDTRSYAAEEGMQDSGFSQVKVTEKILVVGFPVQDKENRFSASRVLHFVQADESTAKDTE